MTVEEFWDKWWIIEPEYDLLSKKYFNSSISGKEHNCLLDKIQKKHLELIEQFKKEVCEEQREICYMSWYREKFKEIGCKGYNERYSIENAPESE